MPVSPPPAAGALPGPSDPVYPAPQGTVENQGGSGALPPARATLPGKGKTPDSCGKPAPVGACFRPHPEFDGKPVALSVCRFCHGRGCSRCAAFHAAAVCIAGLDHPGGRYADAEGYSAFVKATAYARHASSRGSAPQWYADVIVSAPPRRWRERSDHRRVIRGIRRAAKRVVRKLHRDDASGAVVVHLWRGCRGEYDRWGPHAHVLVLGGINVGSRYTGAFHRKTGWVVRQVQHHNCRHLGHKRCPRYDPRFVFYQGASLLRHLVYELGHASFIEGQVAPAKPRRPGEPMPSRKLTVQGGTQAITYFGPLARFAAHDPECAWCHHGKSRHPTDRAKARAARAERSERVRSLRQSGAPLGQIAADLAHLPPIAVDRCVAPGCTCPGFKVAHEASDPPYMKCPACGRDVPLFPEGGRRWKLTYSVVAGWCLSGHEAPEDEQGWSVVDFDLDSGKLLDAPPPGDGESGSDADAGEREPSPCDAPELPAWARRWEETGE